jgi:hypothetical protein
MFWQIATQLHQRSGPPFYRHSPPEDRRVCGQTMFKSHLKYTKLASSCSACTPILPYPSLQSTESTLAAQFMQRSYPAPLSTSRRQFHCHVWHARRACGGGGRAAWNAYRVRGRRLNRRGNQPRQSRPRVPISPGRKRLHKGCMIKRG